MFALSVIPLRVEMHVIMENVLAGATPIRLRYVDSVARKTMAHRFCDPEGFLDNPRRRLIIQGKHVLDVLPGDNQWVMLP